MNTKAEILKILQQNVGRDVSGAEIASVLGVSRNAVCKGVNALKKEGWQISAATNRGYSLCPTDLIDPQIIGEMLGDGFTVIYEEETTSTNDLARKIAENGGTEGTVVIASHQTKGRGRKGREFVSPRGTGVYMSVLLRPRISAEDSLYITVAAAVAAARAIESASGVAARVKWVNDVYCRDKKVCGILTEAAMNVETLGLDYVILGVGINVYEPADRFPEEIRNIAGAVCRGDVVAGMRNRIAADFVKEFFGMYKSGDISDCTDEYRRRSNIIGREITVWRGNQVYDAVAEDIDRRGGLVVRLADGSREILQSGEITIRSKTK